MICGIDPGIKGALATIERGYPPDIYDMPILNGELNVMALVPIISANDLVIIEAVTPIFRASAMSSATASRNYGILLGIIYTLKKPLIIVKPKEWQKAFFKGFADNMKAKQKSAIVARRLYPSIDFEKKDGRIDALLIATWGLNHANK